MLPYLAVALLLALPSSLAAFGDDECRHVFTSTSGSLTSPNFPNPYTNVTQCQYFIRPPLNDRQILKLTPVTFDLDPGEDILEVRNESFTGIYLGSYTGTFMPTLFDKGFFLLFTADGQNMGTGFNFTWTVVGEGVRLVGGNAPMEGRMEVFSRGKWGAICRDDFSSSVGQIACMMMGSDGSTALMTKRYGFSGSWMTVDKCMENMTLLSQCLNTGGECWYRTAAGVICKDASESLAKLLTPKASSPEGCDVFLDSSEGRITSPEYPIYPNNAHCIYTIRIRGSFILMNFTIFDLEDGSDYLEIRENGPSGRFMGRFTGNQLPPRIYAEHVWMKFTSNDRNVAAGFQATYKRTNTAVRLENGTRNNEGRPELYGVKEGGSRWVSICRSRFLRLSDVQGVCNILGYKKYQRSGVTMLKNAAFGYAKDMLVAFTCPSQATTVSDCSSRKSYCDVDEALALKCFDRKQFSRTLEQYFKFFLDPLYTELCASFTPGTTAEFNKTDFKNSLNYLKTKIMRINAFSFPTLKDAVLSCENSTSSFCTGIQRLDFYSQLSDHLDTIDDPNIENVYRFKMSFNEHVSFCAIFQTMASDLPDARKGNTWSFKRGFKNLITFLSTFRTPLMEEEIKRECGDIRQACPLRDAMKLVEKSELYNTMSSRDTSEMNFLFALTMNTIFFKYNYPNITGPILTSRRYGYDGSEDDNDWYGVLKRLTEVLSEYIDQDETEKLQEVMSLLPDTISDRLLADRNMSTLWSLWQQTRVHLKTVGVRKKYTGVKVLHTNLDPKAILQLSQLKNIEHTMTHEKYSGSIAAEKLSLDSLTYGRYLNIQTNFRTLLKYYSNVIVHSLRYFDAIYKSRNQAISQASTTGADVDFILNATIVSLGDKGVKNKSQLVSVWAVNCNPLKWFGGVSKTDTVSREEDYFKPLTRLQNTSVLVQAMLKTQMLTAKIEHTFLISEKFLNTAWGVLEAIRNGEGLSNCQVEVDEVLSKLTDITLEMNETNLMLYKSNLESTVEEACKLIGQNRSRDGVVTDQTEKAIGLCSIVNNKIEKMTSAYTDLLERTPEIIVIFSELLEAKAAAEANREIISYFDYLGATSGYSRHELALALGITFASYTITTKQMIQQLCDKLEYRSLGVLPEVCNQTIIDKQALLSLNAPSCQSSELQFHTLPPYIDGKPVDTMSLYAGEFITVKIPNTTWMYNEGWITSADLNSVIYVSEFEVYIPSHVESHQQIRVEIYADTESQLGRDRTSYKFLSNDPMVFKYMLTRSCRQSPFNPFGTSGEDVVNICPLTEHQPGKLVSFLPSVLANYRIRIYGLEGLDVPDPSTPIPLRIGLRTCTLQKGLVSDQVNQTGRARTSCSAGQFWSFDVLKCQDCPTGSKPVFGGFYCEVDE